MNHGDFTQGARELIRDAEMRARSLGHTWVGDEHLLLALAAHDGPVGEVIRGHGVTVPQIEKVIVGPGHGRREGLFDSLDREALASVGIDLDLVRDTIERRFGPTRFRPVQTKRRRRLRLVPRLVHRHAGRFTPNAKRALSGAVKSGRSDLALVTVGRLAVCVIMLKRGAVPGILATIGVSEVQLIKEIIAKDSRTA
ncbi:MAG TPA: Clp protease N-terminal domain-containing protein [Pseudonocardiaceae bacterium]|nr:Clp protease N-terminal domain-containing protein [Pseudonocardiaceae bacterium]